MNMSLNRKIWVYTEGESETALVTCAVRNHLLSAITKSEYDFVTGTSPMIHITTCNGGSDIPYAINRNSYKVKNDMSILIVSDTEKTPCPAKRKSEIIEKLDSFIDLKKVEFALSMP